MANSNGRIFDDGKGISLTGDIAYVLGSASTDVSTLCEDKHINPWAKFKPIPCLPSAGNNTPKRLTAAQIMAENYGTVIDFDPDGNVAGADWKGFAQKMYDGGTDGVRLREWNDTSKGEQAQYHRMTDFIAPTDYVRMDGKTNPLGYDHYANPAVNSGFTVQLNQTERYTLRPLIPADKRNMKITNNSTAYKFEFPWDGHWLPAYYANTAQSIQRNEEWLYPMDLVASHIKGTINAEKTARGVVIFRVRHDKNDELEELGGAYDVSALNGKRMVNSAVPDDSYLDLTNESKQTVSVGYGTHKLNEIDGDYFFVEYWHLAYTNGNTIEMPIPGFSYRVSIERFNSATIGELNRESNPWQFGVELNGEVLIVSVGKKSGTSNFTFSSAFSSLDVVVTPDEKGTAEKKKDWNMLTLGTSGSDYYYEDSANERKYYFNLGLNGALDPQYMGMYAVVVGVFKEGGNDATGTLSQYLTT